MPGSMQYMGTYPFSICLVYVLSYRDFRNLLLVAYLFSLVAYHLFRVYLSMHIHEIGAHITFYTENI